MHFLTSHHSVFLRGMVMKQIANALIEKTWLQTLSKLEHGALIFVAPDGLEHRFRGPLPGPVARFELHDWQVLARTALRGDVAFGEDYIDGGWDTDNIERVVALFLLNRGILDGYGNGRAVERLLMMLHDRVVQRNSMAGSRRNIEAHYDVGNDFYSLWLDKSMTYSSALFAKRTDDLYQAQMNKYGRILDRFVKPKADVLEIGCGWGGFAERAAGEGHRVTGLTVSPSQARFADERLHGTADIRLEDYRKIVGRFDMIVSIEMFEAVGEQYWPRYFRTLAEHLKEGGRAVVQTITIRDDLFAAYRLRSDFIRHYVFPGGMLPSLQRFREEAERAGLKVLDSFTFGRDYVRTLRIWSARMKERTDDILALGHDDKFVRNWQYYLNICAAVFDVGRTNVAQIELAKA
jgi:cyclopropane-fatty-acyl-phospholipid synthase